MDRKKKILILDRFYFPDEQATSIYLTELVQSLSNQFEFHILSGPPAVVTEKQPPPHPAAKVFQVPCIRLPKSSLFARFLSDASFLLTSLLRGLFLPRPDLLVTQTSPPGVWWIGFLLSRWHRVPWVHIFQDIFPDNLKVLKGNRFGFFFSVLDQVSSFPLKKANQMVAVGEDMKKRLIQKGLAAEKIRIIHNGVDLHFIRPLSKKNSFSEKYQLIDRFVVLYAGNFGRINNFEDFLGAAKILQHCSEIVFVMVGEGALRDELLRQIRSQGLTNVRIIPFEPRSKLPEVLATADVSVVLLRKGMAGLSIPSKIYSILASGRPILACAEEASDLTRLVLEAGAGFVIPPGDPEGFAQALDELFQNADLRQTLGTRARSFIENKNFQRRSFQDYEQLFRSVLR